MLARVFKTNSTAVAALRQLNSATVRLVDSRRNASHSHGHSSTELQHGADSHGHGHDVEHHGHGHGHHDHHQMIYERLWRNKATLDWLPKPEGSWQEANGKQQAYNNQILAGGIIAFALGLVYLRTVIVARSGALTQPPYHLIGHEDFPGSKYDDAPADK